MAATPRSAIVRRVRRVDITVTLDEDLLRVVKLRAHALGVAEADVIDEALRRESLPETLDRIWAKVGALPEDQAMELAVEAQAWARRESR